MSKFLSPLFLFSFVVLLSITSPLAAQQTDTTRFADGSFETGKVKSGKREGTWTLYDAGKKKVSTTAYFSGEKQGHFVRYENGSVREEGQFAHNDSAGTWADYYPNGKKQSVRHYKNGMRSGSSSAWDENGTLLQKTFYSSPGNFEVIEFYPSGHKQSYTRYVNGMKEGRAVRYNDFYYAGDSLARTSEYHLDSLNGVEIVYLSGMKISETHYSHGKREGIYIRYDNAGRYALWVEYHHDEMDGACREYTEGQLTRETHFSNGKKNGSCVSYRSGVKVVEQFWNYGRMDSTFVYDPEHPAVITQKIIRLYSTSDSTVYARRCYYANGKLRSEAIGSQVSETVLERTNSYRCWSPDGTLLVSANLARYGVLSSLQAWNEKGTALTPGTDSFDEWVVMHIDTGMSFLATSPLDSSFKPRYHHFYGATDPKDCRIYPYAEVMPTFPGGEPAFFQYLLKNIRYPTIEKENNRQGTVYISFVVRHDGKICFAEPVKTVPGAPGLTKESLRVIRGMPDWNPGTVNGRPVNVMITQPIRFVLQ